MRNPERTRDLHYPSKYFPIPYSFRSPTNIVPIDEKCNPETIIMKVVELRRLLTELTQTMIYQVKEVIERNFRNRAFSRRH